MNNVEYWKKRILEDEEENHKDSIEEYERQIKILQDAKMEIRKTIKLYLSQLKKNNSLDNIQEVNKLLEEDELEEFHWDYKKYVEKAKEYASYVNKNSKELVLLDRA